MERNLLQEFKEKVQELEKPNLQQLMNIIAELLEEQNEDLDDLRMDQEILKAALFAEQQEMPQMEAKQPSTKKPKVKKITVPPNLEELSHTELVEITRYVFGKYMDPEALACITRQISKDELISAIEGESKLQIIVDPIEEIREKIYAFINENYLLKTQMTCSTHCPTCPYSKVINCFTLNRRKLENETTKHVIRGDT